MRNEYPRPDFVRTNFISLDEEWDFEFDDNNVGHKQKWFRNHKFSQKINVPFCFESKLSGINDYRYHDHVWYHKTLNIADFKQDETYILYFEGVDYLTEIYLNGCFLVEHIGSNGAFNVDLAPYLKKGNNELVVYCFDPSKDISIPRGKQDWEEKGHAIWYTRTTGIYKPVWLSKVNKAHIERFYITTALENFQISLDTELTIDKGSLEFIVNDNNEDRVFKFEVNKLKSTYVFNLPVNYVNERVWTLERPFLYNLTINLYNEKGVLVDTVKSYFGIREVTTQNGNVLINGRPVYQKLVLNQGYYIDGILTAPTLKDLEFDIDAMMAMGFNGCRIHQKTEDPYFLYLADKKGFLIWQECAENYGFNNYNQRRMLNEWIDIVKNNYNHPSIIAYTPINESWGVEGIPHNKMIQAYDMSLYYLIHSLDSTRLVISNDGWEHCKTDLLTVHNYNHGEKDETEKYEFFVNALSDREHMLSYNSIRRFIINPGFVDEGQPILLTEFGGVAFKADKEGKAWGYTYCTNADDYVSELKRIYKAIEQSNCIVGICYTQLTDVEQEVNGLLTYDRKFKVDPKIIKEINDSLKLK